MQQEAERGRMLQKRLAAVFFATLLCGWLFYFFLLLMTEHFCAAVSLDFMLHDNYSDGTNDWFRDFVEVNVAAVRGDAYLTGACANYPPLALLTAKLFGGLTPRIRESGLSFYALGKSVGARIVYFSFFAAVWGFFVIFLLRYLQKYQCCGRRTALLTVAGLAFGYSMIFAFERGNYILLALIAFLLFLLLYETAPTASAAALAVCACLKVYPVLFFLLFLRDRRYRALCVGLFVGAAGLFLPMLFLKGSFSEQLSGFLGGVLRFSADSQAEAGATLPFYRIEQHSNSLSNIFRLPAFLLTRGGANAEKFQLATRLLSTLSVCAGAVLAAVATAAAFLTRALWKRCTALLCLILLLPNNTFDYMLILFLPLLAVSLCKAKWADRKYVVVMTLLAVVPKSFFFLDVAADVSIQTVLNPLLMVVLLLFLAVEIVKEMRNSMETGRE